MIEQQELHCHACSRYVQFEIDITQNGNYVLDCPNCGHQHCRVVRDGIITDVRWNQRNGPLNNMPVFQIGWATSSATSTFDAYSTATTASSNVSYDTFLWADTAAST